MSKRDSLGFVIRLLLKSIIYIIKIPTTLIYKPFSQLTNPLQIANGICFDILKMSKRTF
jgi:hypothetical protein